MKELKENLAVLETYKTADTRNKENFPAWRMTDEMRLEQLAMTGALGRSFYAITNKTNVRRFWKVERRKQTSLEHRA